MNSLVDTHTFIWWITADARLTAAAKAAIEERLTGDRLFLSVASAWEIAIKVGKGRLTLPINPGELLPFAERRDFIVLGLKAAHIQAVADLPQFPTHRDPFDRMLIAQAQVERLRIITIDAKFALCDVPVLW